MCRNHFVIDDSLALRAFRPEDRWDPVNGLNDWAVTRWLGRVPHPYRLDHANAFLTREEHLYIGEGSVTAAAAFRLRFVTMIGLLAALC